MKKNLTGALITLIYYIVIYFINIYALKSFPSNGGPSEAVFLLFGFVLLSAIIFVYCLVKLTNGDTAKMGAVITHLIAMIVFLNLLK